MGLLIKRNNDLFPKMSNLFDDFVTRDLSAWNDLNVAGEGNTMPAVNIKETDNEFQIQVAAPGFDKADFNIELNNDILTISTEHKSEKEEKNAEGRWTRREFNYRSFKRSFTLPADLVNGDKVEASYINGVLNVAVPKLEEKKPKPSRLINVL